MRHRRTWIVVASLWSGLLVTLAPFGRTAEQSAGIVVDASQQGHPISKYIYGQFIEHLGRCIYGGIWAEMLEDRKFYYPVTPEYDPAKPDRQMPKDTAFPVIVASPWQILGAPQGVQMVKESPFVGEHTPRLAAGSGIQQNSLGLVKGKEYVGYVWLKATGPGSRVTVTLSGAAGEGNFADVAQEYCKYDFRFTASDSTDKASLAVRVEGADCFVGTVSLMPADNVQGMRADTLALLKELNSPVYRWPGGNFVSGYDWRDGVGDRDRRPPRKNPAWTGVEHNDFGLHEFMAFCRLLDTEPLVVVNTGLGDVSNAVAELQYANAPADSPLGKERTAHGHAAPFQVKWWGVGNEMYGNWQLGHMPLEKYIQKHNAFVDAMRAVDSSIKVIGVGATGPWSEGMMQHSANHLDLISEHFYCRDKRDLVAHVQQIPRRSPAEGGSPSRLPPPLESLKGKDIDIALDEWNYWYGPHVFGELGTRYFLKDALGIAAGLHEYARQSDIMFMANYAQTVNVIGCIKTTRTAAVIDSTGLALQLYRQHYGTVPVGVKAAEPLDVVAALTEDGKTLTIAIVNPTLEPQQLPLSVQGVELAGGGQRWQIAGNDPQAYNDPGQPLHVKIEQADLEPSLKSLSVQPCSITLFALPVK